MKDFQKHRQDFQKDTLSLLHALNLQLKNALQEPGNRDVEDEIFRLLHSIKSGAAFFQLSEMEETLHTMEGLFESMKAASDPRILHTGIQELLEKLPALETMLSGQEASSGVQPQGSDAENTLPLGRQEEFIMSLSPFEKQLLREAEDREEELFRLCVQLDPEERLPHVRFYLLLNNLECHLNVICFHPPLDDPDQDFSSLTFILSSDQGDEPVFEAINVDGILQSSLVSLDYSVFLDDEGPGIKVSEHLVRESLAPVINKVELDSGVISRLKDNLLEMKEMVLPLPPGGNQRDVFLRLIGEMEEQISAVSLIPFSALYPDLKRFALESAARVNKALVCDFRGGGFGMKIQSLEILIRILIQLVRNAVSHGVETPQERQAAGKEAAGHLIVEASMTGDTIKIAISDDGKGVDRQAVADKLGRPLEKLENQDILGALTKPGFTTSSRIDRLSGRGIGLDLVRHDVENALGGSLSFQSAPGRGSCFTLTLPGQKDLLSLLVFQTASRLLAVPKRNSPGILPLKQEQVKKKEHNQLYYSLPGGDLPLFSPEGRLCSSGASLESPYILLLQHLGKKAAFPVEELVLEKELIRENFFLGRQKEPFLYEVRIGEKKADFLYLSPGIIS